MQIYRNCNGYHFGRPCLSNGGSYSVCTGVFICGICGTEEQVRDVTKKEAIQCNALILSFALFPIVLIILLVIGLSL